MKLINLIGKAFILLGIIMMASSYASYEKIGTLRGNANCGTRQQKDICSPTNNRGEATREKYNLIREDCITTTERICVPGKNIFWCIIRGISTEAGIIAKFYKLANT